MKTVKNVPIELKHRMETVFRNLNTDTELFSNITNRYIFQVKLSFLHYKLVLNIIQWHLDFYSPNYRHMGPSSSGLGYFGFLLHPFLIIIFLLIFEPNPAFLTQAKLSLKSILPEQELQDQTLCHRQGASSNFIFSHKSVKNSVSKATLECLPISFSPHSPCPLLLQPYWSDMRS